MRTQAEKEFRERLIAEAAGVAGVNAEQYADYIVQLLDTNAYGRVGYHIDRCANCRRLIPPRKQPKGLLSYFDTIRPAS